MKKWENNFGMVQKKNPILSKLQKQLAKPTRPSKLIALKRVLTKKANKTQLKPNMHAITDFKDATAMALSDKFPYGKYKDKTLRHIIKTDPMWLSWIINNSDGRIRLCSEAQKQMAMFAAAETIDLQEGYQAELEEGEFGGIPIEDTF
jgi:hypothetical protein